MKKRYFILIISLYCLSQLCCLNNACAKSSDEYIQEAKRYLDRGEYRKADKIMQEMLEKYPTDKYALKYKAAKLVNEGNIEESYEIFHKIISYYPEYSVGYMYLGKLERMMGNDEKAKLYFDKAIALNPKSQAHAGLGGLYSDQGRYEEVVEELEIYLKYNKPTEEIYIVLGDSCFALGRYEKALDAYKRALAIEHPRDLPSYRKIGETYERMEQWSKALKIYETASKKYSNNKRLKESLERVQKIIQEQEKIEKES